jgi:hypothetical protein
MRRFLISLLLASTAASPALAAPRDRDDREQTRSERQEARSEAKAERQQQRSEARSERSVERSGGQQRPQFTSSRRANDDDGSVNRSQRMVRNNDGGSGQRGQEPRRSSGRFRMVEPQSGEPARVQVIDRQRDAPDSVTNWRRHERRAGDSARVEITERRQGEDVRRSGRRLQNETRARVPTVSRVPRAGTQPPLRAERRRTDQVRWSSSHWRKDHRYNWQDWRRRHRSHFHLGLYFDPFGWGYQRYSIGWRLWPSYYSSRYWLNDPWSYRLPYAPPGYRWIRYYDDAVLVDTWTGEVVDVIYNFFW